MSRTLARGETPPEPSSVSELPSAFRRAQIAHSDHAEQTGTRDEDWPTWYAQHRVREQTGEPLPT